MSSQSLYKGRVVHLTVEEVRLPNGETVQLEIIRHRGAAAVVPLKANGDVVLIRQYRHAVGGYIYEVPAGVLMAGEGPEACARREAEEETGYQIERLSRLTTIFTTPGFCDEQIHLFVGTGLVPVERRLERAEVIEVVELPFAEAMEAVREGRIQDAKSVAALLLTHLHMRGWNR